jgi:RNA polymerase sigma factor (TIGR02999 family)
MSDQQRAKTTDALRNYVDGREHGASPEQLIELVYEDLRSLADDYLASERSSHTLSPPDLVQQAYLRMVDQTRVDWRDRTHFFAVAAFAIRRLLTDYTRRDSGLRRGGDLQRVTMDPALKGKHDDGLDPQEILALDAAIEKLAQIDPREVQVVELRLFVGLSNEEVAEYLVTSTRSVERDWLHAQAWLRRELAQTS